MNKVSFHFEYVPVPIQLESLLNLRPMMIRCAALAPEPQPAAVTEPRLDGFLTFMLSEDERKDGVCLGTRANVEREIN